MGVTALAASLPAVASNDIVYAARYYSLPGTPGKSSFHIYTISPDGNERKQLAFGGASDEEDASPLWSPNGKSILFVRYVPGSGSFEVWAMDENGKRQRKVLTQTEYPRVGWGRMASEIEVTDDPEGDSTKLTKTTYDLHGHKIKAISVRDERVVPSSPDGRYRYDTEAGQFLEGRTGQVTGVTKPAMTAVAWISNTVLACVYNDDAATASHFCVFDVNGKPSHQMNFVGKPPDSMNSVASTDARMVGDFITGVVLGQVSRAEQLAQ